MGVIFDSCVWVALAAHPRVDRNKLAAVVGDAPVFTSVVSIGELGFGVQSCIDPAERSKRAAFLRHIEQRPTLDITKHTAAAFGVLAASVKFAGRSPRPRYNDLWIAAQVIEYGYSLLTLNPKDFEAMPGLTVLAPGSSIFESTS